MLFEIISSGMVLVYYICWDIRTPPVNGQPLPLGQVIHKCNTLTINWGALASSHLIWILIHIRFIYREQGFFYLDYN
jgi:hypothetical protein